MASNKKSNTKPNGVPSGVTTKHEEWPKPKRPALVQTLKPIRGGTANIVERDGLTYLALTLDGMAISIPRDRLAWLEGRISDFRQYLTQAPLGIVEKREVENPIVQKQVGGVLVDYDRKLREQLGEDRTPLDVAVGLPL